LEKNVRGGSYGNFQGRPRKALSLLGLRQPSDTDGKPICPNAEWQARPGDDNVLFSTIRKTFWQLVSFPSIILLVMGKI
jgi:hypothetical protein